MMFIFLTVGLVIWVMFAHYVADFIVQTAWMAEGKSKTWTPLVAHIVAYTFTITMMGAIPLVLILGFSALPWWILYCVINGLAHMATDYYTSRASGKAYKAGNLRRFWAIIGLDQFIHMATFWIVFGFFLALV